MPRHLDEGLETKVLEAARTLWVEGGANALTIRDLAKRAGTTPPALYRRFRSREAILKRLVEVYLSNYLRGVESTRSPKDFALRVLEIALRRPEEYELFLWGLRQGVTEARPVEQLFMLRCVEAFGGSPDNYIDLALVLRGLLRGTVMQLIEGKHPPATANRVTAAYERAVEILIENRNELRFAKKSNVT